MKAPTLPSVPDVLLVCGSRDAKDPGPTRRALSKRREMIDAIVVGGAPGVDTFAEEWAKERGIPVIRIDAQWDYYKKAAGPIRNGWMLRYVVVTRVLAMPGHRGTLNMIEQARRAKVPVTRVGWKRNKD